jgi:predicted amidophosphoribosyltransferase
MRNFEEISCCRGMHNDLIDKVFIYDIKLREFACHMKGTKIYYQIVRYCPYCGQKLTSLADEYCDELEKTVGKEFCDIKEEEIPEEFKSDEWWKKRGL